jgi:hypothetical protein
MFTAKDELEADPSSGRPRLRSNEAQHYLTLWIVRLIAGAMFAMFFERFLAYEVRPDFLVVGIPLVILEIQHRKLVRARVRLAHELAEYEQGVLRELP